MRLSCVRDCCSGLWHLKKLGKIENEDVPSKPVQLDM